MNQEMMFFKLLSRVNTLNRMVKEPGWKREDTDKAYQIKDKVLGWIFEQKPEALEIKCYYVPYYSYSRASKDKAGDLMRADGSGKPFEYYLSLIEPGPMDVEVRDRATVEVVITCMGEEFCFHQPIFWYAQYGSVDQLEKKAWINATDFHHDRLEGIAKEIENLMSGQEEE